MEKIEKSLTDYPEWFFAWTTGTPYITTICGWTKKEVIEETRTDNNFLQKTWKQIYASGGRVVKVKISICKNKSKKLKKWKTK